MTMFSLILAFNALAALALISAALLLRRRSLRLENRLRAIERSADPDRRRRHWTAGLERLAGRATPRAYQSALRKRLERANLADRVNPARVVVLAGVLALALTVAELAVSGNVGATLLLPVNLGLALSLTGALLDRRANKRRTNVQRSMASTLDLLVLAVEAGLSLDAALREVVAEWHSPASRELERVVQLGQIGLGRIAAMREIAETLDLESLRRLAGRLGTAERLGTSMVLVLRSEAEEARRERRMIATRKVAQAPTKVLIPTALLILPVTMIVVLGPALPQIISLASGK